MFYKSREGVLRELVNSVYIKQLILLYGSRIRIRRSPKDVYSKVYGVESGEITEDYTESYGLVTSDAFSPSDKFQSGTFDEGWLYIQDEEVYTGDTIDVLRGDNIKHRYKVISKESLGLNEEVITRYRLSAYHE